MDRDSSRGRNTVPGSVPSRGGPDGRGRVSSARARIEPGTRFRRRAPAWLIGGSEGERAEGTGSTGETIHHSRSACARCSGSPVSGAQGGGQPEPGVAPMPGYPPKSHARRGQPRQMHETRGHDDSKKPHPPRQPRERERVAGCVRSTQRDTRGEAQGGDSACETQPRDELTSTSSHCTNARPRPPSAAPVEAAGAATEAEHASASERADGVGTNAGKEPP